ncbi:MAG: hypothetical protein KAZ26_22705, partial [Caldilineaceae bacterium]|nr:hypothetical protein [Caldilineaceae bacterium]
MTTKAQTLIFATIFAIFLIASILLTGAMLWGAESPPGEEISPQRDIGAVLDKISGQSIQVNSDQAGLLLAAVASPPPASSPQSAQPLPEGSYVTDFVLDVDAFSFRNYGDSFPEGNLTIAELYEVFGEGVCLQVEGGDCLPTPAAQLWIDQMNNVMGQGHCLGFTVLAYDLFRKNIPMQRFQTPAEVAAGLPQETSVMRTIAQRWSLQTTPELLKASVLGTPREIIIALYALQEPVDLGIFGRKGGGHSMLAYGVENMGQGIYHILVYDNNWPDQPAFVEVDTTKNSWTYALSGENPAEVPAIWEGDADTRTLIFIPLSAYDQPVTCPFCPDLASAATKTAGLALFQPATDAAHYVTVAMQGEEGHLQVSTPGGERLGTFGDGFVNEIAGALAIQPRSALYNNGEPILFLPTEQEFSVQVALREGVVNGATSLRIFGPKIAVAFDNLTITPGQPDQFTLSPDGQQIGYTARGDQSPTVQLVFADGDASYMAVLSGMAVSDGQTVQLGVDAASGGLSVESRGGDAQPITLVLSKIEGGTGSQFASNNLSLPSNGVAILAVQGWQDTASLTITVDEDGDGAVDKTDALADQPLTDLLDTQSSPDELRGLLGEMAVYLQPEEAAGIQQALLDALADGPLGGSQAGQLLFDLGHLGMNTQELAGFVQVANLPVAQSAELIFNLFVDEGQRSEIITTVFQIEAEKSALAGHLANLEAARTLVSDFEFTQQPASGFDSFIASQDVAPAVRAMLVALPNSPNREGSDTVTVAANPINDPSANASASATATPTNIPTATRTSTPVPPTTTIPTATRTNTPVPPTNTPIPTAMRTNTPVPPTNTPIPTATRTSTPVPTTTRTNTPVPPTAIPTATRTNTPVPPTTIPTATRTNTPVPPTTIPTATRTNTPVPPTTIPTATRTNTPVPPTNTPVP